MFPYDASIAAAVQATPQNIADVFRIMKTIDAVCVDEDGLKWFNWLYMTVTEAIENQVSGGGFHDPAWLSELDVLFAKLYFDALLADLTGGACPACWRTMFSVRDQARIARIQFAMAGMNAHINHDLPLAIASTCRATNTVPHHGTPQYNDYSTVNSTLSGLVDVAKQQLNVRLPGDPLPAISHLEDLIATVDLIAFREKAWDCAQSLWGESDAEISFRMRIADTFVATLSAALLVPVP